MFYSKDNLKKKKKMQTRLSFKFQVHDIAKKQRESHHSHQTLQLVALPFILFSSISKHQINISGMHSYVAFLLTSHNSQSHPKKKLKKNKKPPKKNKTKQTVSKAWIICKLFLERETLGVRSRRQICKVGFSDHNYCYLIEMKEKQSVY